MDATRARPGVGPRGEPRGEQASPRRGRVERVGEAAGGERFRRLVSARDSSGRDEGEGAAAPGAIETGRAADPFAAPVHEVSVRAAAPRPEIARLLVRDAPGAREARIDLRGGAFGGASIVVAAANGGVEVRLGAPTEAARLALAAAIDRASLHLRSRGIVVRPGATLETGARKSPRDGRERG